MPMATMLGEMAEHLLVQTGRRAELELQSLSLKNSQSLTE